MLVIQGTADSTNPVEQSRLLVTALQEAGVEVAYIELAGVGHGVDDWTENGAFALAFLDRHLHPERWGGTAGLRSRRCIDAQVALETARVWPAPRSPPILGPPKPRCLDQPIAVSLEDLVPANHF
jgi:acetyl esterase/lipase